jgi:hypothetical protein
MLQKLTIGITVLMLAILTTPLTVMAQEDVTTTNEDTTVVQPLSEDVTAESRETKRNERIEALKQKAKDRLSQTEEKRIQNKCRSAQVIVDKLQTRLNTVVEKRREKYTSLTSKLNELTVKLQASGVDTTELETAIAELDITISTAIVSIETYNTNLSDLAVLECESNPEGFKLMLSEARKNRAEVLGLQGTLKSGINEKIRPILQSIRASLDTTTNTIDESEEQ